ncbi:MAG: dTDP-4-dehydrorhamnose reductase [Bacteroidales bacterium]|nr:dTDP-4-dehydrorhamnose reductase [Bacteroidales bacterium]
MTSQKEILVTGSDGQLGRELQRILGDEAVYANRNILDITDAKAVEEFLEQGNFKYVINCAAYTAVDKAEDEKSACVAVNVDGIRNLAAHAERLGFHLIHISTDYVFSGNTYKPYTESDRPEPQTVYGAAKRKGETALLGLAPDSMVIRTGWLYSSFGKNFVKTILAKLKENKPLRVVDDQIGTPTNAADLAEFIATKAVRGHWTAGIYNFSSEGIASWYDFAKAIADEAGYGACSITPVNSSEYPTAATRPHFSVLDKTKIKATFGITLPYWRDSLRRCLKNMEG